MPRGPFQFFLLQIMLQLVASFMNLLHFCQCIFGINSYLVIAGQRINAHIILLDIVHLPSVPTNNT